MIWALRFDEFEAYLASLGYERVETFEDIIIYETAAGDLLTATVPPGARQLMIETLANDILDNAELPVPQWNSLEWRD